MIVNIIFIGYNAVVVFLRVHGIHLLNSLDLTKVDDDDYVENVETLKSEVNTLFLIIILDLAIGMFFAILGIIGASKYNKVLVLGAGIWYCIDVCIGFYLRDYAGCIIRGFFAYPHIALFIALKKNHITRETYIRERHCCCDSGGEA